MFLPVGLHISSAAWPARVKWCDAICSLPVLLTSADLCVPDESVKLCQSYYITLLSVDILSSCWSRHLPADLSHVLLSAMRISGLSKARHWEGWMQPRRMLTSSRQTNLYAVTCKGLRLVLYEVHGIHMYFRVVTGEYGLVVIVAVGVIVTAVGCWI